MFNNILADQRFLEACLNEDRHALDRWGVWSYWTEVVEAVKETLYRYSHYTRIDNEFIVVLSIDCTSRIYEQYMGIPSRFYNLKTVVRRYAIFYTKQYIRSGGKIRGVL